MADTFELIQAVNVGSGGQTTIAFTSIPSTYTDLQLVLSLRSDGTYGNLYYDSYLTINGAAVSWLDAIGIGTATPSSRNGASDFVILGVSSSTATASTFGNTSIYITNYAGLDNKAVGMDGVSESNGTDAAKQLSAGRYSSSSAVSSITITPYNTPTVKFAQYSTAYLYGVKNA